MNFPVTVTAHSAHVDVTADQVIIRPTLLAASLGAAETVIAIGDIRSTEAERPSATGFGTVTIYHGDSESTRIRFAPHQDAAALAALIDAARRGETPDDTAVGVTGLDFTAVDVETANWNWGSVCQIGAVRFRDGKEVESRSWLCTPPPGLDGFDDINVSIHGITADDVADAPGFAHAAGELIDFLGDDVFIAHNAQFDSTALRQALLACGADVPRLSFACSLALARNASASGVIEVANHKLPTVAKVAGMDAFQHHDACADARAAGVIVSFLARQFGHAGTVDTLFTAREFTLGSLTADAVMPVLRAKTAPTSPADLGAGTDFREDTRNAGAKNGAAGSRKGGSKAGRGKKGNGSAPAPWQSVATPDTIPDPNLDADSDHPLFSQHVTLSGDFEPYDKGELWSQIADHGGQVGKNVTKKTTLLVVGQWGKKTSKEKRADELNEKGQGIDIWPASKLYDVLGLAEEGAPNEGGDAAWGPDAEPPF